ncbi:hypothetical protein [Limnospira platensis]|uniref:hypothetical protein n=1 Tax=Limnospira platensis TaxID=118562 RepID=UPI000F8150F3|nr:hypothetical protein [Arthrospira platensis NCB002]QQW28623.1 hypothetical protein AP9108_27420 [Arthrospira sp. PCC 9108]BDT15685.1 hypothetical protein N39L_54080 [Arthrospira platensis NIES-39]
MPNALDISESNWFKVYELNFRIEDDSYTVLKNYLTFLAVNLSGYYLTLTVYPCTGKWQDGLNSMPTMMLTKLC